ncbi:MAG: cyanophycin synthetase, partial [Thermodesulfobacteriota bacterium]
AAKAGEGREEIRNVCAERGADLYLYGEDFSTTLASDGRWKWQPSQDFSPTSYSQLRCSMKGGYQIENASLVLAAIALLADKGFVISGKEVREGLLTVRWPGRLEHFSLEKENGEKRYLLDGAHNPAGVESLVRTLETECDFRKLVVIWGAMADKDLQKSLAPVAKLADTIILTRPEGERSADPELLLQNVEEGARSKCVLQPTVDAAIREAEQLVTGDDLILIAGSLYLVGASRKILLGELVS